ncbi:MAG: RNA polymerase sigma factor [Polyangiaceae bacterium]
MDPKEAVFASKMAVLGIEAAVFGPKMPVFGGKAASFASKAASSHCKTAASGPKTGSSLVEAPSSEGLTGAGFMRPYAGPPMATSLRDHPGARRISARAVRAKMIEVCGDKLQPTDRDEVMQQTYMRLFRLVDRLPEEEDGLLGLTVVIVVGEIKRHFRKASVRDARHADEDVLTSDDGPEDELTPEKRAVFRQLFEFAQQQGIDDERHRDCLRWAERLARGDEYADIARDEGIPEATVRKRMERFRKHMREQWKIYTGVAGAVLGILLFLLLRKPRPEIVATPEPPFSAPPPSTAVAVETPDQRAARLRGEAQKLCDGKDWNGCAAKLNAARELDSNSEYLSAVVRMRAAIAKGLADEERK